MSEEGLHLDPEIEEILHDVAKDPDSMLLRVDRPRSWKNLHERTEPVRSSEPFLSKAERHLLEVHREQVADLLYRAGKLAYAQDMDPRVWWEPTEDTAIGDDLVAVEAAGDLGELEGLALVRRALRASGLGAAPSTLELAQASLRLVPGPRARILSSLALFQVGQIGAGRAVAASISDAAEPRMLAHREDCLAQAAARLGDYAIAKEHYRHCSELDMGLELAPVFWLFSSILALDEHGCALAADRAEAALKARPEAETFALRLFSSPAVSRDWKSDTETIALARSLLTQVPAEVGQVIAVVAGEVH